MSWMVPYWGLMVQNTELRKGSKNVMVVRNSTAYPQTLRKKTRVVRAVEVTWIPELIAPIDSMGGNGRDAG